MSVADGIRTVIKVEDTELATPDFRESMSRCFVSVGLKKHPVLAVTEGIHTSHWELLLRG